MPVLNEEESEDEGEIEDLGQPHQVGFTYAQLREAVPEVRQLIRKYRKNTEALLASAKSFQPKKWCHRHRV